jgi:ligand-binding SRPBCC domain-containing protein
MREHTFKAEQTLNAPLDRVFAFFSDAGNLEAITPPFLQFHIDTPRPIQMKPGAIIDYSLKLHGIRFHWRTRITAWEPGVRFMDEQVKGPYTLWVHEHTFAPLADDPSSTVVRDTVRYAHPGWPIEPLVHRWLVRPRLDEIFKYRAEATRRLLEQ